jgi:hypothetical protein
MDMEKAIKCAWRQGKATGMCERCDNEPAEYLMHWWALKEPLYLCRFCKQEVEKQFEIEEDTP